MIVLVFSILSKYEYKNEGKSNADTIAAAQVPEKITAQYQTNGPQSLDAKSKLLYGASVITDLTRIESSTDTTDAKDAKRRIAIDQLAAVTKTIIDSVYGEGAYTKFIDRHSDIQKNQNIYNNLPPNEKFEYDAIKASIIRS